MAKQGFGPTNGLFTNSGIGNNSISLILPVSDQEQFITSIIASYSPADPADPAYFQFGRLLIVAGSFSNGRSIISPITVDLPADVPSPVFDVTLSSSTKVIDFGPRGFSLAPGSPYTVILSAPATNTDTFPAFTDHYGFLNVLGFDVGKAQPFETLR